MKHILTLETSDIETALNTFFKKEKVKCERMEIHPDSTGVFTVATYGLTPDTETQEPETESGNQEPESVAEAAAAAEPKKDAVDIFGSAI